MSRVKIVATIGPRTADRDSIRDLLKAGMDVARLNGAHADMDWHSDTIDLIRSVDPNIPILLDLPGSKVRTVQLTHEPLVGLGDQVILTTEPGHYGLEKISLNNKFVHDYLSIGDKIVADDGLLRFEVEKVSGRDIICRSETVGTLGSGKGINLGPIKIPSDSSEIDRKMIDFSKEKEVDFVGVSFLIYNGKKFIPITVSEDMVGHKLGEFAPTRQFHGHTPADKKAAAEKAEAPTTVNKK